MRNIFLLPTDKPSSGYILGKCIKELSDVKIGQLVRTHYMMFSNEYFQPQNIYITNDEEIKEGDWYLDLSVFTNNISIGKGIYQMKYSKWGEEGQGDCKKIILTDNEDLIKDGVQAIDDDFLQWFVKNSSCEKVEVKSILKAFDNQNREIDYAMEKCDYTKNTYKIILPKEEFKTLPDVNWRSEIINKVWDEEVEESFATQLFSDNSKIIPDYFQPKSHLENVLEQLDNLESTVDEFVENSSEEKLREAGEKWVFETNTDKWSNNDDSAGDNYGSFIEGVKSDTARDYWFEKFKVEWYNEEEVEELLNKRSFDLIHKRDTKTTNEWFDKYKKK